MKLGLDDPLAAFSALPGHLAKTLQHPDMDAGAIWSRDESERISHAIGTA